MAVADLAQHFRGELISPSDTQYDAARAIWNGAIDRHPGLIARCTGAVDVRAAVRFGRERELLVAVRAGGHNVAGTAVCDGGLVIDLSPMKGLWVDPAGRTARAQPGLLWGEFDRETQAFGLAAPGGIITHTGIAGLTLGGGLGWLMRRYGLAADNVLSADVVTADGDFLRASAEHHADLFWGLRGGGGNFGVVTSFEYRLHSVGSIVLAGVMLHPAAQAREVLSFYRDFIQHAPDELTTIVVLRMAPPAPFLPLSLHGQPVVVIGACYAGSVEEGEKVVTRLRQFFGVDDVDVPFDEHLGKLALVMLSVSAARVRTLDHHARVVDRQAIDDVRIAGVDHPIGARHDLGPRESPLLNKPAMDLCRLQMLLARRRGDANQLEELIPSCFGGRVGALVPDQRQDLWIVGNLLGRCDHRRGNCRWGPSWRLLTAFLTTESDDSG